MGMRFEHEVRTGHERRVGDEVKRRGRWIRSMCLPFVAATAVCATTPTTVEDPLPDADVRVLFLGNSLTYTNDLPFLVQTIAEVAGHTLAHATIARPNYSLEDHWNTGGADAVRAAEADYVIMQQGPSSLPANQEYLRSWTERFAPVIREAGGTPALYMVWPDDQRLHAFADVRDAYEGAASSVEGLFIPAGSAWQAAWDAGLTRPLYGPDGFHPSRLGSEIAALSIFRALFDEPLTALPARMVPTTDGLPIIDLGTDAALILAAVEAAWSAVDD